MHVLISAVSSAQQPSGICRHAASLASSLAMAPSVSRVSLVIGPWQQSYFRHAFNLARTSVDIVIADVSNNPGGRNLWYYRKLPKLAKHRGADIVHLSFPAPIRRDRFSCPVICSLHDLYPYDEPGNFGSMRVIFNRRFLQLCLQQSDFVVCSSDFTRDRLTLHSPATERYKTARIYQAVALDPASSRVPKQREVRSGPFLLTVAQHRSNKNLSLLLSAYAALREESVSYSDLRLVIVGAEGPETRALHDFVERRSLSEHVIFQSALPDAELCWLYQHCALVILPPKIEGFCLPLAEALRCGSKVLCSDIPILREVGGSQCSYFNLHAQDPIAELTSSIASAMRDPRATTVSATRFAPEDITPQYVALYRRLLAGQPQSALDQASDEDTVRPQKYAV